MSTQVLEKEQAVSKGTLTVEQRERAAAFAKKAREHASTTSVPAAQAGGSGTTTYNVALAESGGGFALLGWIVNNSVGGPVIASDDWVGVFVNANQALSNPDSNYLDFQWASDGHSYTTDVALQNGYVAAYVIKNASGNWVTVAVTSPYQG